MNKKQLLDLGIAEDVAEQIIVLHGKDVEQHKGRITTLQAELDTSKVQLSEAGTTIAEFKTMDIDAIKKSVDEYKQAAEKATIDATTRITTLKRDHALERELKETYKGKDVTAIRAHLDIEKLQYDLDKDTFIGLKEQVEPLQAKAEYLFVDDSETPKIVTGGNNKTVISDAVVDAARKAANLPPP